MPLPTLRALVACYRENLYLLSYFSSLFCFFVSFSIYLFIQSRCCLSAFFFFLSLGTPFHTNTRQFPYSKAYTSTPDAFTASQLNKYPVKDICVRLFLILFHLDACLRRVSASNPNDCTSRQVAYLHRQENI